MKKLLAVFMVLLLVASVSSAQDIWGSGKMRAGVGGNLLLPSGSWGNLYGLGFGAFGKFEYGLNEDMALQASVGFVTWGEKDNSGVKTSASAFPAIIAAFKYNLKSLTPGLYGFAEYGLWSNKQKADTPAINLGLFTFPATSTEVTSSDGILAIGAGYDTGMLDFSAKYTLNGNFANIILGAAYNFGL